MICGKFWGTYIKNLLVWTRIFWKSCPRTTNIVMFSNSARRDLNPWIFSWFLVSFSKSSRKFRLCLPLSKTTYTDLFVDFDLPKIFAAAFLWKAYRVSRIVKMSCGIFWEILKILLWHCVFRKFCSGAINIPYFWNQYVEIYNPELLFVDSKATFSKIYLLRPSENVDIFSTTLENLFKEIFFTNFQSHFS